MASVEPVESGGQGEAGSLETGLTGPSGEHWLTGWEPGKPKRAGKIPATILQKSKSKCRLGLTWNPWRPLTEDALGSAGKTEEREEPKNLHGGHEPREQEGQRWYVADTKPHQDSPHHTASG